MEISNHYPLSTCLKLFHLNLTNDLRFNLIATPNSADFLTKLAEIMSLEGCISNRARNIVFTSKRLSADNIESLTNDILAILPEFPDSGWQRRTISPLILWENHDDSYMICETGKTEDPITEFAKMWQVIIVLYESAIKTGGFPLHAALVSNGTKNFLLVGKGGSGKSTASRMLPTGWTTYADDEVLVFNHHSGSYFAHALPTWSDYIEGRGRPVWQVKDGYKIDGVFMLERSSFDRCTPIGKGDATVRLIKSSHEKCIRGFTSSRPVKAKELREKLFQNVVEFSKCLDTYDLSVDVDGEYWKLVEATVS